MRQRAKRETGRAQHAFLANPPCRHLAPPFIRDYIANFLILNRFIPLGAKNKTFLNLQSSILDLVYELLDYGFYGSMASLRKILKPLLALLDSRSQLEDDEYDSDNDFDDLDLEEDEEQDEPANHSYRSSRSGKRSNRTRSVSHLDDWLDKDDDENSDGADLRERKRKGSVFSIRKTLSNTRDFSEMTKAATAALSEATMSQNESSVVTLNMQPVLTILPKYTLSHANSRVHLMRKKICKIVYLMCSRNLEIMMKQLLVQLDINKDDINVVAKSVIKRRRMSADHSSFLDTSNLEKFNAKYKKIYHDVEAESSAVNNLRGKFFKSGKVAPEMSTKTTFSDFNSSETFSSIANVAKNRMNQDVGMVQDEDEFMISIFYTVCLMREGSSESEPQILDLDAIITDGASSDSVDKMLIDLMMHEMPDLFESALKLLTQRYYMKRNLHQSLRKTVLVGKEEDQSNDFLRRHLRQLRNDATSFELWKSNEEIQHTTAYIRSIKTLGMLSRLTGIFGQAYLKKLDIASPGAETSAQRNTLSPLLEGSTLECVRDDIDITDIDSRGDSLPLINKLLFGMDSSTRNVSIYLHAILSGCKDYLNPRTTSDFDSLRLPIVLGVFESGYNHVDAANTKRFTGAIHSNLMIINNAVRVMLRVLAIPFDELSCEGSMCPYCGEDIPLSHIALYMENSDFESITFDCYCPRRECQGKPKMLLKKKQRELFALKRKCMSTLEHIALTNLEGREELMEKLPEIEKHIMGGLGAEKCFLAISLSSEYYKAMSESHIDTMISVIERCCGSDKRTFDVSSLETINTEPMLVALRYLRLVAINDSLMRVGILRKLCERTSLVSMAFFCSASSAFKMVRENVASLEDEENLTAKETFEIVESLQLYTITLNLIGELAASKDTEIEGILQTVLPLRHIIDLLCREEIEEKLPMIYGVKAAISKCLICFWFSTSISVPNLIKHPQLPWLVQRLRKDLDHFIKTVEREAHEAEDSDEWAATANSNPEDRVLLEHHKVHKSLAQRSWIYNGVVPILVAFFDDNGPWNADEAPDSLALAEKKLAESIEKLIELEKNNHDHTSDLSKLAKVFGSKIKVVDGGMQLGRKKRRETSFMRAKVPQSIQSAGGFTKSTSLQKSLKQYVDYLETKGSLLHELFRHDEHVVAAKLMGNFFIDRSIQDLVNPSNENKDRAGELNEADTMDDANEGREDEGDVGRDEENLDDFTFPQIAQRMIRYTEDKLSALVQGNDISEQSMEVCRINIIILQRCCELAASSYSNSQLSEMSTTNWRGERYGKKNMKEHEGDISIADSSEENKNPSNKGPEDISARLDLIQDTLGSLGALSLCAKIIGLVDDDDLIEESMKLGHWLVKHGNFDNQTRFLTYVMTSDSSHQFFGKIDSIFTSAIETIAPGQNLSDNVAYNQLLVVVPFLKELMENHRSELQLCMGNQSSCYVATSKFPSFNILQRGESRRDGSKRSTRERSNFHSILFLTHQLNVSLTHFARRSVLFNPDYYQ